jgi:hypothetical protein
MTHSPDWDEVSRDDVMRAIQVTVDEFGDGEVGGDGLGLRGHDVGHPHAAERAAQPSLLFLGGCGAEQQPTDERQPQGSDRGAGQELPQPEEDQQ